MVIDYCLGDFRQLPPVLDDYVWEKSRADGRPALAAGHWNENFTISYLTQKMRCPDDRAFCDICDRVGKNELIPTDVDFFKSKVIESEIPMEKSNDNFKSGLVTIIVTTNYAREKINLKELRSLLSDEKEYVCVSKDDTINKKNFDARDTAMVSHSKTKGLLTNLIIRTGAPVQITTNHSTARYREDGIMNGCRK